MSHANRAYRCRSCEQLLPFDHHAQVSDACQHRCQGRCDWEEVGHTTAPLLAAAALEGPVGPDGLPRRDPARETA